MDGSDDRPPETGIDAFLGEPTRELKDWYWLWAGDHEFPVQSHRGLSGRLLIALKRFLRPIVKPPLADLLDRQRVFNLIVIEFLARGDVRHQQIGDELRQLRTGVADLGAAVEKLEGFRVEGVHDLVRHNDALFALLDQKIDRYRREEHDLLQRLKAVTADEAAGPSDTDEGDAG